MMIRRAAWMLDRRMPCGEEANLAKFLAAEAGFAAADHAMQVHGGFGYAEEYHVARYWREARLMKIAPIAQELVLAYVSEHVLGLPVATDRVYLGSRRGRGMGHNSSRFASLLRRRGRRNCSLIVGVVTHCPVPALGAGEKPPRPSSGV